MADKQKYNSVSVPKKFLGVQINAGLLKNLCGSLRIELTNHRQSYDALADFKLPVYLK